MQTKSMIRYYQKKLVSSSNKLEQLALLSLLQLLSE